MKRVGRSGLPSRGLDDFDSNIAVGKNLGRAGEGAKAQKKGPTTVGS